LFNAHCKYYTTAEFTASYFRFSAFWLAALYHANVYVFRYFLGKHHFNLRPLFQGKNQGAKQGLSAYTFMFRTRLPEICSFQEKFGVTSETYRLSS
jgi:hypothetical protein